jgi:hypothetical protein
LLSNEIALWPSINELQYALFDKWANEKIIDTIAYEMGCYRPAIWLSKNEVDWSKIIVAKR